MADRAAHAARRPTASFAGRGRTFRGALGRRAAADEHIGSSGSTVQTWGAVSDGARVSGGRSRVSKTERDDTRTVSEVTQRWAVRV